MVASSALPAVSRRLALVGLCGGVLSGLLGVGGGIIMVPLLVLWLNVDQRTAHALSLGAIIPIGLSGLLVYGAAGEVNTGRTALLLCGSMFGARLGAGALARIDQRVLKGLFGGFLVFVSVVLVFG